MRGRERAQLTEDRPGAVHVTAASKRHAGPTDHTTPPPPPRHETPATPPTTTPSLLRGAGQATAARRKVPGGPGSGPYRCARPEAWCSAGCVPSSPAHGHIQPRAAGRPASRQRAARVSSACASTPHQCRCTVRHGTARHESKGVVRTTRVRATPTGAKTRTPASRRQRRTWRRKGKGWAAMGLGGRHSTRLAVRGDARVE